MSGLKTKVIFLSDGADWGRDSGKCLVLTEMPAMQAEKWGLRAFLAMKGSDAQIPMEYKSLGMVGVAIIGLNAFLRATVRFEDLEPLLDEMMTCVQVMPDRKHPEHLRPLIPGANEIQEVRTLAHLRSAILELHTGFSFADSLSTLMSDIMTTADSLSTPT